MQEIWLILNSAVFFLIIHLPGKCAIELKMSYKSLISYEEGSSKPEDRVMGKGAHEATLISVENQSFLAQ